MLTLRQDGPEGSASRPIRLYDGQPTTVIAMSRTLCSRGGAARSAARSRGARGYLPGVGQQTREHHPQQRLRPTETITVDAHVFPVADRARPFPRPAPLAVEQTLEARVARADTRAPCPSLADPARPAASASRASRMCRCVPPTLCECPTGPSGPASRSRFSRRRPLPPPFTTLFVGSSFYQRVEKPCDDRRRRHRACC